MAGPWVLRLVLLAVLACATFAADADKGADLLSEIRDNVHASSHLRDATVVPAGGVEASDWVKFIDERTGLPYYVNKVTKAVQWSEPHAPKDGDPKKSDGAAPRDKQDPKNGKDSSKDASTAAAKPQVTQGDDGGDGEKKDGDTPVHKSQPIFCSNVPSLNLTLDAVSRSPAAYYLTSFGVWLEETPYQAAVAGVMVLVGCFCAWDGLGVWRTLFTASTAAVAAFVVHVEAGNMDLVPNLATEVILALQAGAATAFATHCGFEGSQVMLGGLLGFVGAIGSGGWIRGAHALWPAACLIWYSFGGLFGILVFYLFRVQVLSGLAPLLGGFLVTSGVGTMLSRFLATVTQHDHLERCAFFPLPPPSAPWISSASALLGDSVPGALAGHGGCILLAAAVYAKWEGRKPPSLVCLVAWILVTFVESCVSFACRGHCPAWLERQGSSPWPLLGCVVWAAITVAAAWRQFSTSSFAEDFDDAASNASEASSAGGGAGGNTRSLWPAFFRRPDYLELPGPAAGQVKGWGSRSPLNGEAKDWGGSSVIPAELQKEAPPPRQSLTEWLSGRRRFSAQGTPL